MRAWVIAAVAACGGGGSHLIDAPGIDAPTGRFRPAVTFATDANPTSVIAVDLDGDGKLDLVTANTNVSSISILANTTPAGATMPSFAGHQEITTGASPACVVSADFNGDGKPDLATASVAANNASILLNAGSLTFAPHVDVGVGNNPEYIAAGDLDGDGKPDLATADLGSNQVSVLIDTTAAQATTATFATAAHFPTSTAPVALAIGDLDGAGLRDLAVANLNADSVWVLTNTTTAPGSPTFGAGADQPAGSKPGSLALGDLAGNGLTDVVVADTGAPQLAIFASSASGLSGPMTVALASTPDFVAVGDVDGDGKPDLVTADFSANTVSVLLATATGYAAPVASPVGLHPRALAIADLNGDGKADLVVANGETNAVDVLLAR